MNTAISQDLGDIPADRIAVSGWEDTKFDGSGTWTTVDVTTKGVKPGTETDMGPAIQKMILDGTGKTIYNFPQGTYKINTSITINKGDFQIKGAGSTTKFILKGGANAPEITIAGGSSSSLTLTKLIYRGSNTIEVSSAANVKVGDFLNISQQNGERSFDSDNQIVEITKIVGNIITLDMKIGLRFEQTASVTKFNMTKNIKLRDFYLERATKPDSIVDKIALKNVYNAEIFNIESKNELGKHITLTNCRNVLIFSNNIYGNFGFDTSGGYQYGVSIDRCTRVNVINNDFSDLRHHIALQFGSNHCVIGYNRTTIYNHYADYGEHNSKGCHNNLFEGNFGSELFNDNNLKAWGAQHTVWFRNHAIKKIGSEYPEQANMTIIGNELEAGISGLLKGPDGKNNFAAANIYSIDGEGGTGTLSAGNLAANATIPNSLFLTSKPAYVTRWPLYGPGVAQDVHMQKSNATGFAIDGGNGGADNQAVVLWANSATNVNQQWEEINQGGGYYSYRKKGTDFCIDGGNGGAKGQLVKLYTYSSTNQNQHWKKISVGAGKYVLEKRNAVGFSIDGGSGGANGTQLKLWTTDTTNGNQQWLFSGSTSAKIGAGKEVLAIEDIEENSNKAKVIQIYPNPVSDEFEIALNNIENATISIYNMEGQMVYTTVTNKKSIKLSKQGLFSTGIYIVKVSDTRIVLNRYLYREGI